MPSFLENNFPKINKPWDTKKGFLIYSLAIFSVTLAALVSIVTITDIAFSLYELLIFLLIPLIIYLFIFFIRRTWIKIALSRKTNVVIAYNLEGVDYNEFQTKYDRCINTLQNKINIHDLGKKLKIFKKPTDIQFVNHTAAEAKTKLSLQGSTLLIWGYITERKNKPIATTKFSYEFGYPKLLKENFCREIFSREVGHAIEKFEFSIDADLLSEEILIIALFILGLCSYSFGELEKAAEFFEKFMVVYFNADSLKKIKLGPVYIKVKEFLIQIYIDLFNENYYTNIKNDHDKYKEYGEKILKLDKDNYTANILLAYYSEVNGDRDGAKKFNYVASNNAPHGFYSHLFNNAYFCLFDEKDFSSAIDFYSKIPKELKENVLSTRDFLYNKYLKTNNLALLFGDAFIAQKWQNEKNPLIEFIKKAENLPKDGRERFDLLLKEAKNILQQAQ